MSKVAAGVDGGEDRPSLEEVAEALGVDVPMLAAIVRGDTSGEVLGEHPHAAAMQLGTWAEWIALRDAPCSGCQRCRDAEMARWQASRPPTGPCVYRLWGEDDQLLYVGATSNLQRRLGDHRRSQPWANEIRSWSADSYATLGEALAVEITAIADEQPHYNITGQRPWAARV